MLKHQHTGGQLYFGLVVDEDYSWRTWWVTNKMIALVEKNHNHQTINSANRNQTYMYLVVLILYYDDRHNTGKE